MLLAGALPAFAAELPDPLAALPEAPTPTLSTQSSAQSSAQSSPQTASSSTASLTGVITDQDQASIPAARITLTRSSFPSEVTTSTPDGQFSLPRLAPGAFTLTVDAAGFTSSKTTVELKPGETLELAAIILTSASTTDVSVRATQTDIAEAQINLEEKQRVLGIFPNFYVSYVDDPVPLNAKQKFELALRTMVDPISFIDTGLTAAFEQADNLYGWGQGAQGFGKRYAAAYGTFLTGDLLGNAVFPILFKQDPRYFYQGTGTVRSRTVHALAMSVLSKGDNHRWQPDYSGLLGGVVSTALSNVYYPAPDRNGTRLILEGTAIGTGVAALQNLVQEFLVRRLTPHTHSTEQ